MALPKLDYTSYLRESLERRGRIVLRCDGRGMGRILPRGSLVEVRPVGVEELRVGDVVAYHYAGRCLCHRMIRRVGRQVVLKGDTRLSADPPVPRDQIIGRVTRVIYSGARIVPLDTPRQRRWAALRARLSYPIAVVYRCLWVIACRLDAQRGVVMVGCE